MDAESFDYDEALADEDHPQHALVTGEDTDDEAGEPTDDEAREDDRDAVAEALADEPQVTVLSSSEPTEPAAEPQAAPEAPPTA